MSQCARQTHTRKDTEREGERYVLTYPAARPVERKPHRDEEARTHTQSKSPCWSEKARALHMSFQMLFPSTEAGYTPALQMRQTGSILCSVLGQHTLTFGSLKCRCVCQNVKKKKRENPNRTAFRGSRPTTQHRSRFAASW